MIGRIVAIALLVAAVAGAAVFFLTRGSEPADPTLERYAAAWSRGDDAGAARLTDRPAAARTALEASRQGLDGAKVTARVASVREDGDRATATLAVRWEIPRAGRWSYSVRVGARRGEDGWIVAWDPRALHRSLTAGTRLGTVRRAPGRGRIEDRQGRAIVAQRAVMQVAVETSRVRDAADTAQRIANLVDVDAERLERSIRQAGRGHFVPVITLRKPAFDEIADELTAVPGVSLAPGTAPLAPSKGFAGALLGAVGPATAEQLKRSEGRLSEGDEIGQWGLEAAFDRQLAGSPSFSVVIRDAKDGVVEKTLKRYRGRKPATLHTTLDLDVQRAAEQALGDSGRKAALVAVQPSTGDVLAVANRPLDSALNRAFSGLYPPGSTFKVVTTAALLRDGLSVDETVACPRTTTVDGRSFRNFEGSAQGDVPFRVDFAQSCNTAFISLADRLSRTALPRTAADFGIGQPIKLGVPAADGKVPEGSSAVARAAMMIGQDRILASPLIMAGVAATVADGRWRAPRLLDDDPRRAGDRLPAGETATLRTLMRAVVTGGTGVALADLPGEVGGKSGTAEYGGGDPPPTHAWFIAYRGDLAVAVLVEGGSSGGSVAAPIAARFLAAL